VIKKAGGDVMARTKDDATVLHLAARTGQTDVVEWLLFLGADATATDDFGSTPLHGAATQGLAVSKVIRKVGGDSMACTKDGTTVLHCAARAGQTEVSNSG
jgi:ankyrin repeat protein